MLSKNKISKLAYESEGIVYTNISDIAVAIQLHAELGQFEMEVFVDKKKAEKFASALRKKKYYCAVFNFEALKHESRLYVSWMSSF
jgi:hypothetical protein